MGQKQGAERLLKRCCDASPSSQIHL